MKRSEVEREILGPGWEKSFFWCDWMRKWTDWNYRTKWSQPLLWSYFTPCKLPWRSLVKTNLVWLVSKKMSPSPLSSPTGFFSGRMYGTNDLFGIYFHQKRLRHPALPCIHLSLAFDLFVRWEWLEGLCTMNTAFTENNALHVDRVVARTPFLHPNPQRWIQNRMKKIVSKAKNDIASSAAGFLIF